MSRAIADVPTNRREALGLALFLAITAPSEEECQMATELAQQLAAGMPADDVKAAKRAAKRRADRAARSQP